MRAVVLLLVLIVMLAVVVVRLVAFMLAVRGQEKILLESVKMA